MFGEEYKITKILQKRTHWYDSVGKHVEILLVFPWVTNSKKRRFSNPSTYPNNCQKRIIFLSILYFFSTWLSSSFQKLKILFSGFRIWLSVYSGFCVTHAGFVLVPGTVPCTITRTLLIVVRICIQFLKQLTCFSYSFY